MVQQISVLMPPNGCDHVSAPIAKPDALTAMVHDNIQVAPGGIARDKGAAFAALSKLVVRFAEPRARPGVARGPNFRA
jgi:hypothetical protein